jgi:hypothetical protein
VPMTSRLGWRQACTSRRSSRAGGLFFVWRGGGSNASDGPFGVGDVGIAPVLPTRPGLSNNRSGSAVCTRQADCVLERDCIHVRHKPFDTQPVQDHRFCG